MLMGPNHLVEVKFSLVKGEKETWQANMVNEVRTHIDNDERLLPILDHWLQMAFQEGIRFGQSMLPEWLKSMKL